ncbi:1-deoxy-D-xylulose 5-phosphate reductoisomerase [Syntrophomonas zehnderi OL-4]|uniref:1-deoxy-D-xylulose 5-phosphate reductoisomerase n=1 Tax=Syntrophomonas zehnderi OL-4 TaxID=690567 RepID=A0A0E4GBY0_9FIRM|nr:1-deoxy-D-xylulose-5-phosphate reductoisomerase [Syntrophomonas zehnderi]CFX66992.1 1-deoxy-D-xylulose 5-phosphate reductoisomerase [Syntrophomonas zehnderi OL-4]
MNKTVNHLVILGSTGSIGRQALEVVDQHPDQFQVMGLAAKDELDLLYEQVQKYRPQAVALGDDKEYRKFQEMVGSTLQVMCGLEGMCELASLDNVDTVLVALSGAVGIEPTLAAIKKSRRISLANKETLVAAGDLVMQAAWEYQSEIIPVDSEHSAIFQCLQADKAYVKKIWLTASGGPFRDFSQEQLDEVTVEMALSHPNWSMGPKISIDSATMMNKGLEVIEAHHLFGLEYDQIQVLVQKESVIHSMVELIDGSFLAHLGVADMRIPIQYALTYPHRYVSPAAHLDFTQLGCIHFAAADEKRFPALALAIAAGRQGGTMPAVMNAANEVAVHAFLDRKIAFRQIPILVEQTMLAHQNIYVPQLEDILTADRWAREYCRHLMQQ